MKVTYEFDDESRDELKLFERANDMYMALNDISDMIRNIVKYDREVSLETFCNELSELIADSRIGEIP